MTTSISFLSVGQSIRVRSLGKQWSGPTGRVGSVSDRATRSRDTRLRWRQNMFKHRRSFTYSQIGSVIANRMEFHALQDSQQKNC